MAKDIRWEQRFSNFLKALNKLQQAVDYSKAIINEKEEPIDEILDDLIKEGLIQRFEYTHELAWNVMKDYAEYQGNNNISGSRDATREAFQMKLIADGKLWMNMISSRNITSHSYNEETADEIFSLILNVYHPAFCEFKSKMETIAFRKQKNIFEE
jgi:nucleotidyltransferase substrate binding protein (TIGR01987 family)